ncbi:MAG: acetylxylan esterase [Planctomycetota bacterium]|nr:acetylxylan esterase [Planctomycetota bacterium]
MSKEKWLGPQSWERDSGGPIVSLGKEGEFDDTHLFAPCVSYENGTYRLYYPGSRGAVAERVFQLGMATSRDGIHFKKNSGPVLSFPDKKHSILTPALLRQPNGSTLREEGKLRLYFSSTHFGETDKHALHQVRSTDGVEWSEPSTALLEDVYSPTVIKEGDIYKLWFTDVSSEPWCFRFATSHDGDEWDVHKVPVLTVDQKWERGRLFYPYVIKQDGQYLMWYASYWVQGDRTAIGFAVSEDGIAWEKNESNPVFRPDPSRAWESHYTSSQCVLPIGEGRYRMWYGTRKTPPFVNKYFAIGTAVWDTSRAASSAPEPGQDPGAYKSWQHQLRSDLRGVLGIPKEKVALEAESRGTIEHDEVMIEKWVFSSEPGSKLPAVLYRPKVSNGKRPAIVLTFGHGGSKSHVCYQYMGQTFAKLGFICLAIDPIGEEERHVHGGMGTRAHDPEWVHLRAWRANRPIMGKLVYDTMRGIDFLLERDDVDGDNIGVAGNSLGGAKASWMAALETRLSFALISGWALSNMTVRWGKFCTRVPNEKMRKRCTWEEFVSLAAPHCRVLVLNGDRDTIIDKDDTGEAWEGTRETVKNAAAVYEALGAAGGIEIWFEPGGGHRPYPASKAAIAWLARNGFIPGWNASKAKALPELNFGKWAESYGIEFEQLYGTDLHLKGATLADLKIRPLKREDLAVLKPEERGQPAFTIEGWLDAID